MATNSPNIRTLYSDAGDLARGLVRHHGRFRPNAGGAVDNTKNVGVGFSATFVSAGLFDIKLRFPAKVLVDFKLSLWLVAAQAVRPEVRSTTQNTDATWTVRIAVTDLNNAGPAQASIASDPANWITFEAIYQVVGLT